MPKRRGGAAIEEIDKLRLQTGGGTEVNRKSGSRAEASLTARYEDGE